MQGFTWNPQSLKEWADEAGISTDDAATQLLDMGEIDETEHAELLSDEERRRIYE
jgi:hypothetical protein